MTLPFLHIFSSKDFKSQITLQFSITFFVPSSKTWFAKSLWSLQVKVDNLFFTMPIPSAAETWTSTEWSLVCLTVPIFVYLTSEPMNIFWLSIFNKSAWYLGNKHFSGQLEWSKGFIIFKNIAITSWTRSLVWEKISVLADVRQETIYIIDISTAWKAQTKSSRVNFSRNIFGLFRLTSIFNGFTVLFTSYYIH